MFSIIRYPSLRSTNLRLISVYVENGDSLNAYTVVKGRYIKYANSPLCKDCIHFHSEKNEPMLMGRCTKYGTKDLTSGEINYDYVGNQRFKGLCGIHGVDFVPHKYQDEDYGLYVKKEL